MRFSDNNVDLENFWMLPIPSKRVLYTNIFFFRIYPITVKISCK